MASHSHYVTHHFAHCETLDRAERWLLQRGFRPSQLEVHREGVPWITVIATHEQTAEAEMIFTAAELNDPDGWPSFWETARMPHPHMEPRHDGATATGVVKAGPSPVGWHPPESADAAGNGTGLTDDGDVNTRFS